MDGEANTATKPVQLSFEHPTTGKLVTTTFNVDADGLTVFTYAFIREMPLSLLKGPVRVLLKKGLRIAVGVRFTVYGRGGCLGYEVEEDLPSMELVRAKLVYTDIKGDNNA